MIELQGEIVSQQGLTGQTLGDLTYVNVSFCSLYCSCSTMRRALHNYASAAVKALCNAFAFKATASLLSSCSFAHLNDMLYHAGQASPYYRKP
eukprot:21464-Heterococcus_DN1.PRE.5